jgi:Ankyrin repeats (3 copies)
MSPPWTIIAGHLYTGLRVKDTNRSFDYWSRIVEMSVTDTHGWTPLHRAASGGHETVVRFLIDKGANISFSATDGYTPFWEAANNVHKAVIRLLVERCADISAIRKYTDVSW